MITPPNATISYGFTLYTHFSIKSIPFSKNFEIFLTRRLRQGGCVRWKIPCVKHYFRNRREGDCGKYDHRKSGEKVASSENELCKPNRLSTPLHPCGQLLWKSLWIMWKTRSFQQVSSGFACGKPWRRGLHNTGNKRWPPHYVIVVTLSKNRKIQQKSSVHL